MRSGTSVCVCVSVPLCVCVWGGGGGQGGLFNYMIFYKIDSSWHSSSVECAVTKVFINMALVFLHDSNGIHQQVSRFVHQAFFANLPPGSQWLQKGQN